MNRHKGQSMGRTIGTGKKTVSVRAPKELMERGAEAIKAGRYSSWSNLNERSLYCELIEKPMMIKQIALLETQVISAQEKQAEFMNRMLFYMEETSKTSKRVEDLLGKISNNQGVKA